MGRLSFAPLRLPGCHVVEGGTVADARGRFARWFCADEFASAAPGFHIAQVNWSRTHAAGTVRGMHRQRAPHAEAKLIRCLRGRVYDVAVDLREDSPTYLQWQAVELAEGDGRAVLLAAGIAHGFQALTDDAELLYCHDAAYAPGAEAGVRHDDPRLGIAWPLPVVAVSDKDRAWPLIGEAPRP
jgi:dTDP-4-dehydrorhamnose 3,5-epimerase